MEIAKTIIKAFEQGKKLLLIGNGGSSAEASHFAAELVCKVRKNRHPLPAFALNDPAILTSIANDFNFNSVFSRQVEAYGNEGDILVVLSTSGKSMNCNLAILQAQEQGLEVIEWPREGKDTQEIQENQLRLIHQVCAEIEDYFA